MPYTFLSDDWITEVRGLRADYDGAVPGQEVRLNMVVKKVPFGTGTVHAYLEISGGDLQVELGELAGAEATAILDYDSARTIIVQGNTQAAIQAFMSGRIELKGDSTKLLTILMSLQGGGADDKAVELAKRIRDMTA